MNTNDAYHSNRTHISSSILKMLLTDLDKFYETWVLNTDQGTKPQFQEGSLTHALLLEPDEVNKRYAFYNGLRRAGKDYEEFVGQNEGKEILLVSTKLKAERSVLAVKNLPPAMDLLTGCEFEKNMLGEILGIPVKARADAINISKGIILDVKTTAYPTDIDIFRNTVKDFMYELSASLYCKIAEQVYGRPFSFYWIVVSKQDYRCEVYKAKNETLQFGTTLLTKALLAFRQFQNSGNNIDSLRNTQYTNSILSTFEVLEV